MQGTGAARRAATTSATPDTKSPPSKIDDDDQSPRALNLSLPIDDAAAVCVNGSIVQPEPSGKTVEQPKMSKWVASTEQVKTALATAQQNKVALPVGWDQTAPDRVHKDDMPGVATLVYLEAHGAQVDKVADIQVRVMPVHESTAQTTSGR